MPTYEYRCKKCGHHFEEFQSVTDEPLSTCPVCHGEVRRLITGGSGLIFKGSGFYITDYKSNGNKSGASYSNSSKDKDSKESKAKEAKSEKKDSSAKTSDDSK